MKRDFFESLTSEISKEDITAILNTVNEEKVSLEESYKQQIADLTKTNEELKSSLDSVSKEKEDLSKELSDSGVDVNAFNLEIENLQNQIKELKETNRKEKIDAAIALALKDAGSIDNKYARVGIDDAQIKIDKDGQVTGVTEQVEALKKDKPFLFTENTKTESYEPRASKQKKASLGYGAQAAKEFNNRNSLNIKEGTNDTQ